MLQRIFKTKSRPSALLHDDKITSTPRSKTKLTLKKAGIRVDLRSSLLRRLKLGNAFIDHLGKNDNFISREKIKRHTSSAVRAMAEVLQKYRCITQVR
ncbi:hypothetical protein ACJMK2_040448 [Sinanodonta woodiana]|uniref:Uncharacterized protein n=1 Tax=Sinanodonta woodiana TaxID=1069815 RepID=A0ABD3W115_SINWO